MTKKNTYKKLLGYDKSTISLFETGGRTPSWPLAEKLCEIFPGKSLREWKKASPEELKRAFKQLRTETQNNQR